MRCFPSDRKTTHHHPLTCFRGCLFVWQETAHDRHDHDQTKRKKTPFPVRLFCVCCVTWPPTRHTWLLKRKDNSFPGSPPTSPSSIVLPLSLRLRGGGGRPPTTTWLPHSFSTSWLRNVNLIPFRPIWCAGAFVVCVVCGVGCVVVVANNNTPKPRAHTVTRWSHSVCQTEFPYVLGPADPCPTAVDMEPFSTSVFKVFI